MTSRDDPPPAASGTEGPGPALRPLAAPRASPDAVPLIRIEHLVRLYQVGDSSVHALDDVSLEIGRGEFVALMGPSGSGKSTLLNVLGCLDTPTSGTYLLDGEPVQSLTEDQLAAVRQRKIGFIFQAYHLVPRMTALRNVELPLIFAGVEPKVRRERVERALDSVGLTRRMRHRPDQLSGGERQRVAIARAMVMEPSILLADEPTGNLDTRSGGEIVALLEHLNASGLTIVLVTHDPSVASHAKRVLRMRDGKLAQDDTPSAGERNAGFSPPGGSDPGRGRPADAGPSPAGSPEP